MPLSFVEMLGMTFRNTPIGKIRKAPALCESAGLAVTPGELEAHHLCGKDPLVLVEALVTAQELGINTTFREMAAISLTGQDLSALLLEASNERSVTFETFSPQRDEHIKGFTQDRQETHATVTVTYSLSPSQIAFHFDFRPVHERLGAAVSVYINTAADIRALQIKKTAHESELKTLAIGMLPGIRSVAVEYR